MTVLTRVFALLVFTVSTAHAMELSCMGELNGQTQFSTTVQLAAGQRNMLVGMIDAHEIFLSDLGEKLELQAYNPIEPSRIYATTEMSQAGASVNLSIWNRDFWIEVKCTKL